MTIRILPRDEWARLAHLDIGQFLPACVPDSLTVLVVEHDGEIVGCWAAVTILHAEGVWVHPDHQKKGSVARRLWLGMRGLVARMGASSVVTGAIDPAVEALILKHHGQALPPAFVLPVKG